MAYNEEFKGIYTALVTPFHEDGKIDVASLERLVKHQRSSGVHGFYAGGSTGEGLILTADEREHVLETILNVTRGSTKVIAHIGSISTDESIRLARHAEQSGADAISAVAPFYYKLDADAIQGHYEAIMESTSLPLLVYHFPGATGVSLPVDFYERIARNPQCIGVKFTSHQLFELQQIRDKCGAGFLIFNGHDEVYAAGALLGADGAIGSTMNMMPGLYVDMFDDIVNGRWGNLAEAQARANRIIAHMLEFNIIAYEKYVLYLQGIIDTPTVRRPLRPLSDQECQRIKSFFDSQYTISMYRR